MAKKKVVVVVENEEIVIPTEETVQEEKETQNLAKPISTIINENGTVQEVYAEDAQIHNFTIING